jgi:uncharacterized phage protein (TIGR02220 family)
MSFTQIPNDILFNSELNIYSRVLFGIILSLSRENGYCYASNEYLAERIGGTGRAVTNWILELKQKDLIDVQTVRTQGAVSRKIFIKERSFLQGTAIPKQEEQSFLSEGNNHSLAKGTAIPKQEEPVFPIIYNRENIILIDNNEKEESNFSLSEIKKEREQEPAESAKYYFEVTQVLELLTERSGVNYKIPKTKAAFENYEPYKLIKERLKEKATLEDIFAVVEMKNKEWAGTQIYKNFIPSTLFRKSNFDKYLQQLQIKITEQTNNFNNNQQSKSYGTNPYKNESLADLLKRVQDNW